MSFQHAVISLLLLSLALPAAPARAEGPWGQIFESTVGRYILTETNEGRALLGRVTGISELTAENSTYAYRQFLARAGSYSARAEIDAAASQIMIADEGIASRRATEGGEPRSARTLDEAEQTLLKMFSRDRIGVATEAPGGFGGTGGAGDGLGTYRGNRAAFLDPTDPRSLTEAATASKTAFPALDEIPSDLDPAEAGEWQAKNFWQEMKECVKSMPRKARREASMRMALTQLGISEATTVWGYVSGSGGHKVDWWNLPTDMIVGGAAAVVEPFLAMGAGSFMMRYVKIVAFGAGRSVLEGTYFYFTPLKDTHGHDAGDLALARTGFGTSWTIGSTAIKLGLFTAVMGFECMFPTGGMKLVASGVQWGHRLASSYAYFHLRNKTFDGLGLGMND